jgi:hypothetical protein
MCALWSIYSTKGLKEWRKIKEVMLYSSGTHWVFNRQRERKTFDK